MRGSRLFPAILAAVLIGIAVAGCSSGSDVSGTARSIVAVPEAKVAPPPELKPCKKAKKDAFAQELGSRGYASLAPLSPMPAPGAMPPGSTMAEIAANGRLVVGVDQNTLQFGYRDPRTGSLEGFDIDLVREVARAIFPNEKDIDDRITFKALTTQQRIPAVMSGDVDVVASLLTITCDRARDVALSGTYYLAHQRFLVRTGSGIESIADLARTHAKVCATEGSTTLTNLQRVVPDAKPYPVAARTDCLVALQQRKVDAISADDTILRSFEAQDPKTVLLPGTVSDEPYAIAVQANPQKNNDLVRFVNGVLDQLRANGRLDQLAQFWIATPDVNPFPLPEPRYR